VPDYGKPLEFGFFPEPLADPPERVERLVRAAERSGLDLIGIQDHPYQRRFYDTWTLIAYLAARTERVRFFPDVANLPLRPPAMLAKAAASLDVLTRGRVEIGLGAGGPRMLKLTGTLADGWVPSIGWAPPKRLPELHERIDEAALGAGRRPEEIKRLYNVSGRIGPEGEGLLEGSVSKWTEQLSRFVLENGMDTFIFWPPEDHERQVETFGQEVVPAVRDVVEKERSRQSS
jgi:alkanesulfonate monooxygenase SsuD/methylene tetrahydromethanopterin reductase-like flavin-dependent oxidoreductase (luciferase family)